MVGELTLEKIIIFKVVPTFQVLRTFNTGLQGPITG